MGIPLRNKNISSPTLMKKELQRIFLSPESTSASIYKTHTDTVNEFPKPS